MSQEKIFIAGQWRDSSATATFSAEDPATGNKLPGVYPVSSWADCEQALDAAAKAARTLRGIPGAQIADFLEAYAAAIESRAEALVAMAHSETALAISPRLRDVELPRTITQLRQAAAAAREGSWTQPVLDTKNNIRSFFAPIGPVVVFGPNNFPFAFNGVAGGDFAAAIATGCPVLAKAHPLHPGTSRLLATCASEALAMASLPPATVQMIYALSNEDGLRLVSDPRVGAISFTGSRAAGLRLKAAADAAGKIMYLEMSSLNPIVLLPGSIDERAEQLATELADSCLAASGQFCTSPNLILAVGGAATERLASALSTIFEQRPSQVLLSHAGREGLHRSVQSLVEAGAQISTGGAHEQGQGAHYKNTLLRVSAADFLANAEALQREAFGNATLLVTAHDISHLHAVIEALEGNLTGSIYTSQTGKDDALYAEIAEALRFKVGRLLNDKMPTGVALSPAMNHGGPFPSTSHPGFTAVGIPRSLQRFGALQSFDNVRQDRLPLALRNLAPSPDLWRTIDGAWQRG